MSHLILCGLSTCGKTTIGQLIATELNWPFIDTDKNIEIAYSSQNKLSLSCREIFAKEGEVNFRAYERQVIASIACASPCIIAIGGGSLCHPLNINHLQNLGSLIYLKVSPEIIWERTLKKGLPAYLCSQDPKEAFYKLARERMSMYGKIANISIEAAGLSEQEIVTAVIAATVNTARK